MKQGLRVLISGDRNWKNRRVIYEAIKELKPALVIHGSARGADTIAEDVARYLQIEYRGYPAKWDEQGQSAGPRRNRRMLDDADPDAVVWFHDDIEHSKGTRDMIAEAEKRGIPAVEGRSLLR